MGPVLVLRTLRGVEQQREDTLLLARQKLRRIGTNADRADRRQPVEQPLLVQHLVIKPVPSVPHAQDGEAFSELAGKMVGCLCGADDRDGEARTQRGLIGPAGPPPDAPEVRRWLVHCALHADNPLHRALAQLGLFESFCLNQRALLRAAETHLEPMNGERADVERIAEIELRTLLGSREYAAAVLGLDDPWDVLMSAAFVTLTEHADGLQEEVRRLGSELRRELELRQRLLEKLDELPAAEALLLRNCFAEALGEERLTIEQLQVLHPSVLGSIKRNTLDQRLKRLLARGDDALEPRRRKEPALLDLLLADRVEVE